MEDQKRLYSRAMLINAGILIGPFAFAYVAVRNAIHSTDKEFKLAQFIAAFVPLILTVAILLSPLPSGIKKASSGLQIGLVFILTEAFFSKQIATFQKTGSQCRKSWPTVISLLITSLLLAIGIFFFAYRYDHKQSGLPISIKDYAVLSVRGGFDSESYAKLINQYSTNEQKAIDLINNSLDKDNTQQLASIAESESIWSENMALSSKMLTFKLLPPSLKTYTDLLYSYSSYRRLEMSSLIAYDKSQNSDDYNTLYNAKSRSEEVLREIKQYEK